MKARIAGVLASLSAIVFFCATCFSGTWITAVNMGNGVPADADFSADALYTIDIEASPPVVYGPFLQGQLVGETAGEPDYGDGVLDVARIPGTDRILISCYDSLRINLVSLADPKAPVLIDALTLDDGTTSMKAEDIAVSRDGRLAMVSAGGSSSDIAFIDLETFSLNAIFPLYESDPYDPDPAGTLLGAEAVAITPDGTTALFVDYTNGHLVYGTINDAGDGLTAVRKIPLCSNWDEGSETCGSDAYHMYPMNVAISPDGKTAVVTDAYWSVAAIFRITGPGEVEKGIPFQVWGFPDSEEECLAYQNDSNERPRRATGGQSMVFSADGKRIWVVQNGTETYTWNGSSWDQDLPSPPDQLSWLQVDGPGQVSVGGVAVAQLLSNTSGGFFGVDTLALSRDGRYLYVGNPYTDDQLSFTYVISEDISRVDLTTFTTTTVTIGARYPVGLEQYWPQFPWTSMIMTRMPAEK